MVTFKMPKMITFKIPKMITFKMAMVVMSVAGGDGGHNDGEDEHEEQIDKFGITSDGGFLHLDRCPEDDGEYG